MRGQTLTQNTQYNKKILPRPAPLFRSSPPKPPPLLSYSSPKPASLLSRSNPKPGLLLSSSIQKPPPAMKVLWRSRWTEEYNRYVRIADGDPVKLARMLEI